MPKLLTPEDILNKLPKDPSVAIPLKNLLKSLGLSRDDRREFKRLVRAMLREGQLVRHKGGRFSLPASKARITGTLSAHPDGYGFVIPDTEGQSDIFISPRGMADAMDGDRVVVSVQAIKAKNRREGIIQQVLERAHRQVVGRFEQGRSGTGGIVIPQNPRIRQEITIAPGQGLNAQEGELVVAQLLSYPSLPVGRQVPRQNPQGKITRILGMAGDPGIDTEMIIEEFLLPQTFSKECLAAAEALPDRVDHTLIRRRRDLRGLKTVTIDGERARDFDDAISIEKLDHQVFHSGRAKFRLWVHIADVAHYVGWGVPLDLEARKRGNSVYFPDRVIPMFPERLSNGLCSLNPHQDRLTLTAEMFFDETGMRLGYEIYESVIRSQERMTYTQVKEILVDQSPELCRRYALLLQDFKWMEELCEILRRRRMERGSIDFDLPEPEIILDLQGQTTQILKEDRNIAHRIIEEFMLAANETVAQHLTDRSIPMIYRVHEEPDPAKMMAFNALLEGFGLYVRGAAKVHPKSLQQILEQVKGRPEEKLVNTVLLRSMKQARYSSVQAGHFGLATECYTHFTSPIRRYPDLIIHRLAKAGLNHGDPASIPAMASKLNEIARISCERERMAMEAEREVVDIKKVRFMADRIGQVFDGHISGVAPFGFFVELDEIFVEGLVPITSLRDDRYLYREAQHSLVGQKRRRTYRLGDPIQVRVENVDLVRFQIHFALADSPLPKPPHLARQVGGRARKHRRGR